MGFVTNSTLSVGSSVDFIAEDVEGFDVSCNFDEDDLVILLFDFFISDTVSSIVLVLISVFVSVLVLTLILALVLVFFEASDF